MDIKLNKPVVCVDDEHGGHVTGLIINPENDELTHVVVKTGSTERVVPVALLQDASPEALVLKCTITELLAQQPLVETEYVRSMVETFEFLPEYEAQSLPYYEPHYEQKTFKAKHERIPNGEVEIKPGLPVFAKDGRIGRIDDIVVDPVDEHITHIVLREGHLWGAKDVVIDIAHVKSVEADGIYLKATKAQISELQSSHNGSSRADGETGIVDIPVHAQVHCTDGDFGHITCLIVNPINNTITHFVAADRHALGQQHIIPVSFITGETEDGVSVNHNRETLAKQPDFIVYEYDSLDGRTDRIFWPMMLPADSMMYAVPYLPPVHEQIPVDELAVRRGMAVYAAEGHDEPGEEKEHTRIGQVEAFVADPQTGHITHLILREGHLWGQRDVTIPVSAIKGIETKDVQLNLTVPEIEALPAVPVKHWMPFAQ